MSAFLPVIKAFNEGAVSYVVVGGLAAVLHGHARLTADVDIVIRLDATNVRTAVEILTAADYLPRLPVDPRQFADAEIRERWVREKGMLVFTFFSRTNPVFGVDLFAAYPMAYELLLANSVTPNLGGEAVRICSLDDLIIMKRRAGRANDMEDIRMLEALRGGKQP